ncbi:MAG TPA: signal peptide peptidase SppA [Phycisphaerales bacterium]|nr:signal peptide peptidase SppA [Phycisphaerales bacterium]
MRFPPLLLLALLAFTTLGCSGVRFVIDAVPSDDSFVQTPVMRDEGASSSGPNIALIDVTGLILDAERPGLLAARENPVARFAESLAVAASDSKIKAVILRINSPGGGVTASDLMYREVMHFKKNTQKPVIVLMADVAASGGYYLACSGDELIAHPTTITGSIGVIIQTVNFSEGLSRIGIKAQSITSGPNKRMGSPFEPMTQEHHDLLQNIVNEFYGQFKSIVIASRPNLKKEDLDSITDGRVVTGTHAAEVGLVDSVGDLRDAFAAAKRRASLSSAQLVKFHRALEYVGSAYASAPPLNPSSASQQIPGGSQTNLLQINIDSLGLSENPGFYYLWDPSTVWP